MGLRGQGHIFCGGDDLGTVRSTHSMFADDTKLLASSKRALKAMIKDVKEALGEHGLNLKFGKVVGPDNSCRAAYRVP